jgi:tRNA (adenine57-N1/adenine58-N1)-methyltransferase
MYEVLIRPHEVVQTPPTLVSIETISSRLKRQEVKRESRRQIQMEMARKRNAKLKEQEEAAKAGGTMQVDVEDAEEQAAAGSAAAEGKRARSELPEEGRDPKRRRMGDGDLAATPSDEASQTKRAKYDDRRQEEEDEDISAGVSSSWNIERTNWVTRVVPEVRGHTSYLTFATMFPRTVREAIDKREQEKKNRVMVRTAELAGIPIEGGLAKTVAMRAVAGMSSAGSQASSTAGSMGSLPGSADRTITREESFDTQASDGYERGKSGLKLQCEQAICSD